MSPLYKYFIGEVQPNLSNIETLKFEGKVKLIVLLAMGTTIVNSILFFYHRMYAPKGISDFVLPISALIGVLTLYSIKKFKNFKFTLLGVLFSFLILLPIRIYLTGAMNSPAIMYYFLGYFIIFSVFSKREILIYMIAAIAELTCIYLLNSPIVEVSPLSKLIIYITAIFISWIIFISTIKVSEEIELEGYKVRRLETITIMITTLAHEINNPLQIAKGYTAKLLRITTEDESIDKLQKLDKSLDRIDGIMKSISQINKDEDIKVVDYYKNKSMYELKK